jgi:putative membrane protein
MSSTEQDVAGEPRPNEYARPVPTEQSSATKIAFQLARGFLMGSADIVPGVSGGTVALVLGIYRTFVGSLHAGASALRQLLTGNIKGGIDDLKAIDWLFLIPLGGGVASAFLVLRHPMESLLKNQSEATAAVFCGLVLASCYLVWREITNRDRLRLGLMIAVAVLTFVLLGFQAGTVSDPPIWLFAVTGGIAICAMILPGISGSFIMLMFGMYGAVLGGTIPQLLIFLVGATVGLGLFSSVLNWVLEHHEQTILAALLGLMVGSFRVLWPWPNGVGFISDEADELVKGTGLEWPTAGDIAGGLALAAAAATVTLLVVRFAGDSHDIDQRDAV